VAEEQVVEVPTLVMEQIIIELEQEVVVEHIQS
jgi:hypothetical protein